MIIHIDLIQIIIIIIIIAINIVIVIAINKPYQFIKHFIIDCTVDFVIDMVVIDIVVIDMVVADCIADFIMNYIGFTLLDFIPKNDFN